MNFTSTPTSLDNSDEAHQAPPQFFTREAHVQAIRRLIRLSDGADTAIDSGLDFFAVQGALDGTRLRTAA